MYHEIIVFQFRRKYIKVFVTGIDQSKVEVSGNEKSTKRHGQERSINLQSLKKETKLIVF